MANVIVYGADWCEMTHRALDHLKHLGVPYKYINIDEDRDAAKLVAKQNGGKEKKPMLDIDGKILRTPTKAEIDKALRSES